MKPKLIIIIFMFSIILGCQQEIIKPEAKEIIKENSNIQPPKNSYSSRVDTYPLEWDIGEQHHDYMPTPQGIQIASPWAGSGTSFNASPDIRYDYHKSDGWVLLYNTFNTQVQQQQWYFMLYNKYRGIVRYYYYIPSSSNFIGNDKMAHTIRTYGTGTYLNSSPLLNFADQDSIDLNKVSIFASRLEDQTLQPASWYVFEYELAYDKNVISQNSTTFSFQWQIRSIAISNISLSGSQQGTVTGSISSAPIKKSNFDFVTSNLSYLTGKSVKLILNGEKQAEKYAGLLFSTIKSIIQGGLQGTVWNLLGGIFGNTQEPTVQKVNLNIDTKINLAGTFTQQIPTTGIIFPMPGYDQSNTPGQSPAYNYPLGVFYLSSKPIINIDKVKVPGSIGTTNYYYYFTIDPNSFQIHFNPALIGGNGYSQVATISNLKKEIIFYGPKPSSVYELNGTLEQLPNSKEIRRNITKARGSGQWNVGTSTSILLRITFDVIPNDVRSFDGFIR